MDLDLPEFSDMMSFFISDSTNGLLTLACIGLAIAILWWLRADMKKQREWREAKEDKMAKLERKIARKKAQAREEKKDL